MESMQALRIELHGEVTSFRYPHFMWGVQPTFEMPPPATIYGHICSAVGEWIDPTGLRFAYHFTHSGKFVDLEHIHAGGVTEPITSRKRQELERMGLHDQTVYGESTVMPFKRELLFQPHLVLYLDRLDLEDAFKRPRYTVVLGRSQDLCSYPPSGVQVVTLTQQTAAYYEHTLLPVDMAARSRRGVVVLMPRFIDYAQQRSTTFAQYLVLTERITTEQLPIFGEPEPIWCDPDAPIYNGCQRAVVWHRFVEEP